MTQRNSPLDDVNRSGFPLQIAVEHLVKQTTQNHGWTVPYIEHAWFNRADNRNGFIDLVLRDRNKTSTLVVECKRVRDSNWLFMRSDGTDTGRRHCKSWVSRYKSGSMKFFGWHDLATEPTTVEAMYCIQADGKQLIERIAAEVISSTEALAWEEKDYHPELTDHVSFYFSAIVTTAELKVCCFSPELISLKDGAIPEADFKPVPWVRFRKQLSSRLKAFTPQDYSSGNDPTKEKEHTVFVLNAEALKDFLSAFDIDDASVNKFH